MFSVRTERLLLRPAKPEDWSYLYEVSRAPEVSEHLLPGRDTEAAAKQWAEQSAEHHEAYSGYYFGYMILLDGPETPIGSCALTILDKARRTGMIGWEMHPAYWGMGYATEAARALMQLGFGPCQLRRIRADCYRSNTASRRVMEKVGLREQKSVVARLHLYWNYDSTGSKVRYEISRKEWVEHAIRSAKGRDKIASFPSLT